MIDIDERTEQLEKDVKEIKDALVWMTKQMGGTESKAETTLKGLTIARDMMKLLSELGVRTCDRLDDLEKVTGNRERN